MADAVVSFVLEQLKTTIVDKASEEVGLLVGVQKEVEKLERNLRLINTVLRDAEEKKRTDDLKNCKSFITFTREGALTYEALGSLFNHCRRLRVLSFAWPDGTDHLCKEIPEGIGKLIHLRFLHLASSQKLERLPEALCNLLNLESLDLWNCGNLKQLPDSIGKLINLRFLYTAGCSALTQYPKGVQKLTSLSHLSGLIARADCDDAKEFCLADLGNLKHLRILALKVVGNSIDMEEARKAQLQDTQSLYIFLAGSIQRADIIEALDPHRNIPYLRFYGDYWFELPLGSP
ncbi:hypothetical protein SLEP1_g29721 [Rubroshorea leprosula]|uniref:Rx N-terminal domain-containing protein n=1 Tax=Rubroshorea leprosula TaxID=152421 RepID=A0AAV5K4T4_9ROSI|nr:hypothetical protein SLEP1_g29721 [Rubroshorea leprosula]